MTFNPWIQYIPIMIRPIIFYIGQALLLFQGSCRSFRPQQYAGVASRRNSLVASFPLFCFALLFCCGLLVREPLGAFDVKEFPMGKNLALREMQSSGDAKTSDDRDDVIRSHHPLRTLFFSARPWSM